MSIDDYDWNDEKVKHKNNNPLSSTFQQGYIYSNKIQRQRQTFHKIKGNNRSIVVQKTCEKASGIVKNGINTMSSGFLKHRSDSTDDIDPNATFQSIYHTPLK